MADHITTYTGLDFYPTEPVAEAMRIEDIAHALSLICRGNGQVKTFYSVGEHCLNCSAEAEARGYSDRVVLACLLHDACESYMSDVPSPFKAYLRDYIEMEEKMLSMLYQHFLGKDLTEEERALVDQVDHDLLKYDLFYLLNVGEEADLPTLLSYYEFGKASFQEIEERYLRRYEALSNRVKL